MRLPALDGDPLAERRREHLPRPEPATARPLARAAPAGAPFAARVGLRPRRRRARREAFGRAEADRRDRARTRDRRALPDPRRADRVTRVPRDRAPVRARPACQGERRRHPLHLAPPGGDLRDLRLRDRPPRRESGRHCAAERARPRASRRGHGRRRARTYDPRADTGGGRRRRKAATERPPPLGPDGPRLRR